MNRIIRALLVILAIQCFITAVVYWPEHGVTAEVSGNQLMSLPAETITGIRIMDPQGNEAVIARSDNGWRIPALGGGLPANTEQVKHLLKTLGQAREGQAVASSIAARQRFEVASYSYRRRLTLMTGTGQQEIIYLGTAPTFRRVHARNATADPVYSIRFNSFDSPAQDAAWLDPWLLQIPEPRGIRGPGFTLHRTRAGSWEAPSGAQPEPRELEALLVSLANLQLTGIANAAQQLRLSALEPSLMLQVDLADDSTQRLDFFALEDDHFIRDSRYDLFFAISAYDFDRLNSLDSASLNGEPPVPQQQ
ncbi:hypothetical protein CWI75_04340 [Kineobactrum sediminis]|uniref:DUF4340 domain-containing protein n=1 Tax=Kineobactrum sediminis TaxID=1905677 RepID=A0A2N5Y5C0_9GAMM|nr:DUF4340 domain-containing protein [Kineobactrum sediminis]PLW83587.1 hypothetical protein CWI75_04340 [Kineobactrum sediminis]